MFEYYAAAYTGTFLTAISQVLLKIGSNQAGQRKLLSVYANPYTITAYLILLVVTLLNFYAYKILPLKLSTIILPYTYILVGVFSFVFLKERITRRQILGSAIIIFGIVLFKL